MQEIELRGVPDQGLRLLTCKYVCLDRQSHDLSQGVFAKVDITRSSQLR